MQSEERAKRRPERAPGLPPVFLPWRAAYIHPGRTQASSIDLSGARASNTSQQRSLFHFEFPHNC